MPIVRCGVRIRSIKPEFWRSDDIASLSIEDRLLFIGLWSYVDDSGVGIDKVSHIVADLFALDADRDFREAYGRVTGGLSTLSTNGLITRYTVDGKPFLYITTWARHQRIEKPSRARFPAPTCENAVFAEGSPTTTGALPEPSGYGAGEQGNRGTGEQSLSSTADAASKSDDGFAAFYAAYPKKVGKGQAVKAWRAAIKKASPDDIMAGLEPAVAKWALGDPQFIPNPATWLNGERWDDELDVAEVDEWAGLPTVEELVARRGF